MELIRHWLDYGFWFDRQRQTQRSLVDVDLVGAQRPPGGGRQQIDERIQARFFVLNQTFPHQQQIRRIFGTMLSQKLASFGEESRALCPLIVDASLELYQCIAKRMLPTPTKIHYLFSMRDLSKVFQGLLRADASLHDTRCVLCAGLL